MTLFSSGGFSQQGGGGRGGHSQISTHRSMMNAWTFLGEYLEVWTAGIMEEASTEGGFVQNRKEKVLF